MRDDERPSEAERCFYETTSKKNLTGVRGRASRRGNKGPVKTPYDLLRGKAKKEYAGASRLEVYQLYEREIVPYDIFSRWQKSTQQEAMTLWRKKYPIKEIIESMGVTTYKFYQIIKDLGIHAQEKQSLENTTSSAQISTGPNSRWTQQEIDYLREAYKNYMNGPEEPKSKQGAARLIYESKRLNRTLGSIENALYTKLETNYTEPTDSVAEIERLRAENTLIKDKISDITDRLNELEALVNDWYNSGRIQKILELSKFSQKLKGLVEDLTSLLN
jgi:hypothetical protein